MYELEGRRKGSFQEATDGEIAAAKDSQAGDVLNYHVEFDKSIGG